MRQACRVFVICMEPALRCTWRTGSCTAGALALQRQATQAPACMLELQGTAPVLNAAACAHKPSCTQLMVARRRVTQAAAAEPSCRAGSSRRAAKWRGHRQPQRVAPTQAEQPPAGPQRAEGVAAAHPAGAPSARCLRACDWAGHALSGTSACTACKGAGNKSPTSSQQAGGGSPSSTPCR